LLDRARQSLIQVKLRLTPAALHAMGKEEARRIVANIAKLPELLSKP